jgi:hypothetical protein
MPKLNRLALSGLRTEDTPYPTPNSFDSLYKPRHYLPLKDRRDIDVCLRAILQDFRIVRHSARKNKVDLRLAEAVLRGKAEIQEGGYRLIGTEEIVAEQ